MNRAKKQHKQHLAGHDLTRGDIPEHDGSASIDDRLTDELAECVMGWKATSHRYLAGNRVWTPRHRFQPLRNIANAFYVLMHIKPDEYLFRFERPTVFYAYVKIGGRTGEAVDRSMARAITTAIARAHGIEVRS